MSDPEQPKLAVEIAAEQYAAGDKEAFNRISKGLSNPAHCDNLILHPVGICKFCDEATEAQAERARLDISNTGVANRKWPCPSQRRRSLQQMHAWSGNRPKTSEQLDEEAKAFRKALREAIPGLDDYDADKPKRA